jgi:arginyl-tRNA synthetase
MNVNAGMSQSITDRLTHAVLTALATAGLPAPEAFAWDVPRLAEHGDYATNAALVLAKAARRAPRDVAALIVRHFPALPEVERLEIAGPGFLNVTLAPAWCAGALREILAAGAAYGTGSTLQGTRIRLEFVSANPTGPLVIVNARAAAIGDSMARLLRSQGARVTTDYYVNDAGTQFEALARSLEARIRQALGEAAALPDNGYPGEYLVELAADYVREFALRSPADLERHLGESGGTGAHLWALGRYAVDRIVAGQRRVLAEYGVPFDAWTSEMQHVRQAGLPERAIAELVERGRTYEADGAVWFRSTDFGDDKDRVLIRSSKELTYFAVDVANHHYIKYADADRVIDLLGPDHHGYVGRMRAAMEALGHPPASFEALIVQLVTLLREGQPVRMSKRRGEFVLMEELLEEVGRDAARFTFLTRRHDSPLEFDLAVATRQSAENPVYYVQYAHARIRSIWKQVAEQGLSVPPWAGIDLGPLALPEELALMKRLVQYPDLVISAARALEPHRIAFWLGELAGLFHPYYKAHRVLQNDPPITLARLALCTAVGQVIRNGLDLLGVSAPESM